MIRKEQLNEICKNYGINYETLIRNNSNLLEYGEYQDVCRILDFLRDEVKIETKNIEKCPGILYYDLENIEANWKFLKEKQITNYNVEGCLHILSTEHAELIKTYNYIMENYGVGYLNEMTSILRVNVERIMKIEIKFKNDFKPENFIQAACSGFSIEEIEKIVSVCTENGIKITGSVFRRTAEEIKRIVKVCKENEMEITGSVFLRTAEEIEEIVKVCRKNEIKITGSVFLKPAEEIEEIVKVCRKNRIEITGSVFLKSAEEIEEIVKVCKENEIKIAGSIFQTTAEEIKRIIIVCKEKGIEITGSVFKRTAKEIEKIVKVCEENEIEITGTVFLKSAEEIEEIVKVCRKIGIEITGSVFLKTAEEIEKIVKVCEENEIEMTGSIFLKTADALERNIEYIRSNYGEEFLKSLILSKNYERLIMVLPYLKEKGVLDIVIKSPSILRLKLSEIQEREKYIEQIGETLLSNDGQAFNPILGWSRKKFKEKSKECTTRKITGEEIGEAVEGVANNIDIVDATQSAMNNLLKEKEKNKN